MAAKEDGPDAGRERSMAFARDKGVNMSELRTLVALLEGNSATHIAERFGLSRDTVPRLLKKLDGPLDGLVRQTFHEEAGKFVDRWQPTERGRLVEPALRQVLDAYERLLEQLEQESQIIRIGFIRPLRRVVQRALKDLTLEYQPGRPYLVRFFELTSEEQAPMLDSGELDVAVAYAIAPLEDQARSENENDSGKSRFYARLLCNKQHYDLVVPAAAVVNGKVQYEQLNKLCYVALPARRLLAFNSAVNDWLASKKICPVDNVQDMRATTILTYAGSGRGFGFLPHLFAREFLSEKEAAFVSVPELPKEGAIKAYVRAERRTLLQPLINGLREGARARWEALSR